MKKLISLEGYTPSTNEEFMNDKMLAYFERELLCWEETLHKDIEIAKQQIKEASKHLSKDEVDISIQDINISFYFEAIRRDSALINSINLCLERIKNRTYGYCQYSKEPIELRRLKANPIALYSLDVQEMLEHKNNTGVYNVNLN